MLPLLMSALAIAMCWPMATFCGPYGIEFIAVVDLSMLSDVHAIIAADAGDKARVENIAAVIKIVFIKSLPWNETGVLPVFEVRILHQQCFREKLILRAVSQRFAAPRRLTRRTVPTRQRSSAQCFARSPMLPVAVSGSQDALPRSLAWHL